MNTDVVCGLDYMGHLRPYVNSYHQLAARMIRPLFLAGGYRLRVWVTEPMAALSNFFNQDIANRSYRDFYLNIYPGSICYMVGIFGDQTIDVATGDPMGDVEIIEAATREAWFRTSENVCLLAGSNVNDTSPEIQVSNATFFSSIKPCGFTNYMLPNKRHIVLKGQQVVRIVANGFSEVGKTQAQVALWCLEPEVDKPGGLLCS